MDEKKIKIAIVVHGRFYAFNLAKSLIRQGHRVVLFTNYPKWAVKKFGIDPVNVRSFWIHGIIQRLVHKIFFLNLEKRAEPFLHRIFSRWALSKLVAEDWDVIHVFSGVGEEILRSKDLNGAAHLLVRASAHICFQDVLLKEESERAHTNLDRPSPWMVERELREYQLANVIMVLSSFCMNSFIQQGTDERKLICLPLGAELGDFRPAKEIVDERIARILSGAPLRVLMVGTMSYRKGALDFFSIAAKAGKRFSFRFVGDTPEEMKKPLRLKGRHEVQFISRKPEFQLPAYYNAADLFIFPTIEDGCPAVLAQAMASGLPILTTTNCSGPDLVREDETGWILPIRDPDAFLRRLYWCDENRGKLALVAQQVYEKYQPRDWSDVAVDFVDICEKLIKRRNSP